MKKKRIMLLLTSGLGNCVLATPAILELRRILPDHEVSLFGPRKNLDLLNDPAFADEFIEIPAKQSLMRFLFSHPEYLFRRYESAFSFCSCNPGRLYLLKQMGSIGNIYAVRDQMNAGYRFDHAVDMTPGHHEAEMDLDLLKLAGLDVRHRTADLCLTEKEKKDGYIFWQGKGIKIPPVVIHPSWTLTGSRKSLPIKLVAELVDKLIRQSIPVRILLGKEEKIHFDMLPEKCGLQDHIITDISSPRQLAGILSHCPAVISADSGPGHIASAVGVQVITLWGPTCAERSSCFGQKKSILRLQMHPVFRIYPSGKMRFRPAVHGSQAGRNYPLACEDEKHYKKLMPIK